MDTRDVRNPPQDTNGNEADSALNPFSHSHTAPKKTTPTVPPYNKNYRTSSEIRTPNSKKTPHDLLIITQPKEAKKHSLPIGFMLSVLALGVIFFVGLLTLTLLTRKAKTVDFYSTEATASVRRMVEGAQLFADHNFTESKNRFTQAKNSLQRIDGALWFIPLSDRFSMNVDPRLSSIRGAVRSALELALAGEKANAVAAELMAKIAEEKQLPPGQYIEPSKRDSITGFLTSKKSAFNDIVDHIETANNLVSAISLDALPREFHGEFTKAQKALGSMSNLATRIATNWDGILEFLGDEKPHTILILLQNSSELRPTGGFIGNLAFVQFNQGTLTQQEVRDIYSFDHKLTDVLEPPPEIKLINNRWYMRDANSSLNFATSARQIADFLKREKGPAVDTIVSVDQSVIKDLLAVTGPLKIDELPAALTQENFEQVLSFVVEAKIYGREDPKVLLKSLLPALQKNVRESGKILQVAQALRMALATKHIQAYSVNEESTKLIHELNIDGKAIHSNDSPSTDTHINDYFAVSHFSIGGNKSDLYMKEALTHSTFIQDDGSVINEVTVKRSNTWNSRIEESLKSTLENFGFKEIPANVLTILGKAFNIHSLRVYAPKGSVLVDNKNPNITTHEDADLNATYFSVRLEVAPGDTNSFMLRYKLPTQVQTKGSLLSPATTITYNLQVIKQPGQDAVTFTKNIFPTNNLHIQNSQLHDGSLLNDQNIRAIITH